MATIQGVAELDEAGHGVELVSDFDGDGHGDLLIGPPGSDGGGSGAGAACVLCGPLGGTLSVDDADALFGGVSSGDDAGAVLISAGDEDGDGNPDLRIGAPRVDVGSGTNNGAASLIQGSRL